MAHQQNLSAKWNSERTIWSVNIYIGSVMVILHLSVDLIDLIRFFLTLYLLYSRILFTSIHCPPPKLVREKGRERNVREN